MVTVGQRRLRQNRRTRSSIH